MFALSQTLHGMDCLPYPVGKIVYLHKATCLRYRERGKERGEGRERERAYCCLSDQNLTVFVS